MDQFASDPFGDEQNVDESQDRNDSRDSLFLMADMRIGERGVARQVRVRNLSAGGLMAEFPEGLDQGTPLSVDVRGIGWVDGRVAWSAAGRIGVAFDREIDPIRARKPVGQGAKTPGFTKPIIVRR
jgi:hypothetical protein